MEQTRFANYETVACIDLSIFWVTVCSPTLEQVALHESELKRLGKAYEFHMYPNAGHGFFYQHRPNYRQEQAVDGWNKLFIFLGKHLLAGTR